MLIPVTWVFRNTEPKKLLDMIVFCFIHFYDFTRNILSGFYVFYLPLATLFQNNNILNVIPSRRSTATTTTTNTATHSSIFPIDILYSIHYGFEAYIFFTAIQKIFSENKQQQQHTHIHTYWAGNIIHQFII